ncbi:unnamed protein product [Diabrotica balteata]|uniref:RCC1 and BTB domain-containing protein 1 n=1 Tax=Diabrotica balteata TaxID=107213 RepID=A0A9N9T301_DIABA|nr:unnamed protein product [Diabrotica balteata]
MYPKSIQDIAGWNIKYIGTRQTSIIVAADESVIVWGASACYGKLGMRDMQMTSTTPKEVNKLSSAKVTSLTMGICFTLFVTSDETSEQKQKLKAVKKYAP